MRFFIINAAVRFDSKLSKMLITFSDPDSYRNLGEMALLGWNSILLKVMGWWAFDVFT